MKNFDEKNGSLFREMTEEQIRETRGGICILPMILGEKAAGWLLDLLAPERD